MHGLIFVTWEKYLSERFGSALLKQYRAAIGETPANAPLISQVYSDDTLLAGVGVVCKLTQLPVDTLLREYGHFYITNSLTSHLCAYLLSKVHSGRDLLLMMSTAHAQMRRTSDKLTPPLFKYETISSNPNHLMLMYDSPRQLCSVLYGAIQGAAERYGDRVRIFERACMKHGALACRFEVIFSPGSLPTSEETPEQRAKREAQQKLARLVLEVLPGTDGYTLAQVQMILQKRQATAHQTRPSVLLEALRHLTHAGLISSTANQPGDDLTSRRYWRSPTSGK